MDGFSESNDEFTRPFLPYGPPSYELGPEFTGGQVRWRPSWTEVRRLYDVRGAPYGPIFNFCIPPEYCERGSYLGMKRRAYSYSPCAHYSRSPLFHPPYWRDSHHNLHSVWTPSRNYQFREPLVEPHRRRYSPFLWRHPDDAPEVLRPRSPDLYSFGVQSSFSPRSQSPLNCPISDHSGRATPGLQQETSAHSPQQAGYAFTLPSSDDGMAGAPPSPNSSIQSARHNSVSQPKESSPIISCHPTPPPDRSAPVESCTREAVDEHFGVDAHPADMDVDGDISVELPPTYSTGRDDIDMSSHDEPARTATPGIQDTNSPERKWKALEFREEQLKTAELDFQRRVREQEQRLEAQKDDLKHQAELIAQEAVRLQEAIGRFEEEKKIFELEAGNSPWQRSSRCEHDVRTRYEERWDNMDSHTDPDGYRAGSDIYSADDEASDIINTQQSFAEYEAQWNRIQRAPSTSIHTDQTVNPRYPSLSGCATDLLSPSTLFISPILPLLTHPHHYPTVSDIPGDTLIKFNTVGYLLCSFNIPLLYALPPSATSLTDLIPDLLTANPEQVKKLRDHLHRKEMIRWHSDQFDRRVDADREVVGPDGAMYKEREIARCVDGAVRELKSICEVVIRRVESPGYVVGYEGTSLL